MSILGGIVENSERILAMQLEDRWFKSYYYIIINDILYKFICTMCVAKAIVKNALQEPPIGNAEKMRLKFRYESVRCGLPS